MGRSANGLLSAQWRERLSRWRDSGLSIVEFCRREEISQASFFAWRKRLGVGRALARGGKPPGAEVASREARFLEAPPPAWPLSGGVQITLPGGAVVALPPHASSEPVTGAIRAAMLLPAGEDRPC
jgi:hypothetical protein